MHTFVYADWPCDFCLYMCAYGWPCRYDHQQHNTTVFARSDTVATIHFIAQFCVATNQEQRLIEQIRYVPIAVWIISLMWSQTTPTLCVPHCEIIYSRMTVHSVIILYYSVIPRFRAWVRGYVKECLMSWIIHVQHSVVIVHNQLSKRRHLGQCIKWSCLSPQWLKLTSYALRLQTVLATCQKVYISRSGSH